MVANLVGGILSDVGEHLIPTCVQSRLEDISRWRFDNIGWHFVPGPKDPNGEDGLEQGGRVKNSSRGRSKEPWDRFNTRIESPISLRRANENKFSVLSRSS